MNSRIAKNPRVERVEDAPLTNNPSYLYTPKGMRRLLLVVSGEEEVAISGWEHCSVSVVGHPDDCPTWYEMEAVKRLLWGDGVPCMQWHAREEDYFHGFTRDGLHGVPEVLHIWRPADGDWSRLDEEGPEGQRQMTDEQRAQAIERFSGYMHRFGVDR